MKKLLFTVSALLFIGGCVSEPAAPVKPAPRTSQPDFVFSSPEQATEKAKESVRYVLKDASSAEFRNVRAYSRPTSGVYVVCGEVNSKNSYGAMAGFSTFVSSPSFANSKPTIITASSDSLTRSLPSNACVNR